MQYTCWPMIETFTRTSTRSNASGAHWAMIERCRRTLTALWAPFFSLSSSYSPRESSSLSFIWFSWVRGFMFGVPHPLLSLIPTSQLSNPLHPKDVPPLTLLLSCPSRTSQGSAPCLSSSSGSPSTSLFINCQTDRPHNHASIRIQTETYTHKHHKLFTSLQKPIYPDLVGILSTSFLRSCPPSIYSSLE